MVVLGRAPPRARAPRSRIARGCQDEPPTPAPPPQPAPPPSPAQYDADTPLPLSYWLLGPSPRRAVLSSLLISGVIGPLTNLWGSGSLLLSLNPEFSRAQKLDTFYPVGDAGFPYSAGYLDYSPGFKRYVDDAKRFEFRFPATYVLDQAVYLRNADAAYNRRMMDPQGVMSGGPPRSQKARGPEVALGPADGQRDENLSVVISTLEPGFTMRGVLGAPEEGARRLLEGTINRQAVVKDTTLFSASERPNTRRGGEPLYQFEYRVDYEDERQPPSFTVCVVAADVRANQLYTFASRVPAKVWESGKADDLREAARSFVLL